MAIAPIAAELDSLYATTPRDDTAFYAALIRLATGICLAQTGVKDEDSIQEMVIGVWERIETFGAKSRFSTWAVRVMKNTLRDAYRRRGLEVVPLEAAENEQDQNEAMEAKLQLRELVDRLDAEEQQLVKLHLEGYTLEEIGTLEGITRQRAYQRWQEVMARLQTAAGETHELL